MSNVWLRGRNQKRAKREMQVRDDARRKFGVVLAPEDVRRLAHEILAGEHGTPVDEHRAQVLTRFYAVRLGEQVAYARFLVEQEEVAELLTGEEWQERLRRRERARERDK
jgi:hypothetical protein